MPTEITGNGTAVRGLGGELGFGEITLPAADDRTFNYDVSAVFEQGFVVNGETLPARVYISTNGFITLGQAPYSSGFEARIDGMSTDLDPDGTSAISGGNRIYLDIDPVSDVVTITYYAVKEYYADRRDPDNTFQIQLYDRGNGSMDVALRYESMTWTDTYSVFSSVDFGTDLLEVFGRNAELATMDTRVGNTGQTGLWVYNYIPPQYQVGTIEGETLTGTAGNDRLVGLGGDDTLIGGAGNDNLRGSEDDDSIIGGDGDDTLNGGTGADTLVGGNGSDRYEVQDSTDVIVETASGSGTDRVFSNVSWVMFDNTENLKLMGEEDISATGNAGDNFLIGNNGANLMRGGAGNDRIEGRSGDDTLIGDAGEDTLIGGPGSDVYVLPDGGDRIAESGEHEGTDKVFSAGSFDLRGTNIEDLELTGTAATNGLGSGAANTIIGNGNDNVLRGFVGDDLINGGAGNDTLNGDSGADTLIGGQGSDLIYVDDAGDRVGESRNWAGHDTVMSSVDFRMGRSHIEDLHLTGDAILGAGNGLGNEIRGTSGDNVLDGGRNNDTLMGGAGNDTYLVRAPGDLVIEAAGRGLEDTVKAFRAYELTANVERLYLQTLRNDAGEGVAGINGIGNGLDNTIVGNPFDNAIIGREGRDTLRGQAGADSFVFDRQYGPANVDRIIDFNTNEASEGDMLRFKGALFGDLSAGALAPGAFRAGTMALDANDRFIFDRASGQLWFDEDGSGGSGQHLIATFEQNALVTASDIEIF